MITLTIFWDMTPVTENPQRNWMLSQHQESLNAMKELWENLIFDMMKCKIFQMKDHELDKRTFVYKLNIYLRRPTNHPRHVTKILKVPATIDNQTIMTDRFLIVPSDFRFGAPGFCISFEQRSNEDTQTTFCWTRSVFIPIYVNVRNITWTIRYVMCWQFYTDGLSFSSN